MSEMKQKPHTAQQLSVTVSISEVLIKVVSEKMNWNSQNNKWAKIETLKITEGYV